MIPLRINNRTRIQHYKDNNIIMWLLQKCIASKNINNFQILNVFAFLFRSGDLLDRHAICRGVYLRPFPHLSNQQMSAGFLPKLII
jgi:hypothetical protein